MLLISGNGCVKLFFLGIDDKKVDEERIMYENQIKSQIDNTLHKIYDKINNLQ